VRQAASGSSGSPSCVWFILASCVWFICLAKLHLVHLVRQAASVFGFGAASCICLGTRRAVFLKKNNYIYFPKKTL
jgi:hypothetical protein